jgi:hypothetical protein
MKRQQPPRYTSDQAALQWMRIEVRVSEPDVEQLLITVSLSDLSEAQRRACVPYLKGHRRHRLAVRTEDLGEWEQAHFRRDHVRCRELRQDVMLLWDQPITLVHAAGSFLWQDTIPNGVIVRAVLERLRWAEQPGEVLIGLEQLLLEKEHQLQLSSHWPDDSVDQSASDSDTHRTP